MNERKRMEYIEQIKAEIERLTNSLNRGEPGSKARLLISLNNAKAELREQEEKLRKKS
jgi:hypothetical protein